MSSRSEQQTSMEVKGRLIESSMQAFARAGGDPKELQLLAQHVQESMITTPTLPLIGASLVRTKPSGRTGKSNGRRVLRLPPGAATLEGRFAGKQE
jgi:hypothetical protein